MLRAERQSARMSEITNGPLGLCGKVWKFEKLGFKGLTLQLLLSDDYSVLNCLSFRMHSTFKKTALKILAILMTPLQNWVEMSKFLWFKWSLEAPWCLKVWILLCYYVGCWRCVHCSNHSCLCIVADVETALIGNVADVRSKILSSLVSQCRFGGQLKEGMMWCSLMKMPLCCLGSGAVRIVSAPFPGWRL